MQILRPRQTKIIATLGPSSSDFEQIETLLLNGVDVFRFNFSHGILEEHYQRLQYIRQLEKKYHYPIAAMLDLQGPKIRVGLFKNEKIFLKENDIFTLDLNKTLGNETRCNLPHKEVFQAIEPGHHLLLDDGRLRLLVTECSEKKDTIVTKVIIGGNLSNNKGVNIPDVTLPLSSLTAVDHKNLTLTKDWGFDWIALSFVQRVEDILELREKISPQTKVIAKLEKPAAIHALHAIIQSSDAIMIARGDLGVEMPPAKVPILQKRIIHACRTLGKPIIVATQMLETMTQSPIPTRAEASDVATAVYDGADAVMLSAETASGKYPFQAVQTMSDIIEQVEKDETYTPHTHQTLKQQSSDASSAICISARHCAESIQADAIATFTTSGATTLRISQERPRMKIISISPSPQVARQMCLLWGVHSIISDVDLIGKSLSSVSKVAEKLSLESNITCKGNYILITAGVPFGKTGTTNILRLIHVGCELYPDT